MPSCCDLTSLHTLTPLFLSDSPLSLPSPVPSIPCPFHPLPLLQNPAFLTLRKIEAAREIASTVAASANRIFLNSDSLLLNLSDYEAAPGKRK